MDMLFARILGNELVHKFTPQLPAMASTDHDYPLINLARGGWKDSEPGLAPPSYS